MSADPKNFYCRGGNTSHYLHASPMNDGAVGFNSHGIPVLSPAGTRRLRDYLDGVIGDRAQEVDEAAVEQRAQQMLDDYRVENGLCCVPLSDFGGVTVRNWHQQARRALAAEAKAAPNLDPDMPALSPAKVEQRAKEMWVNEYPNRMYRDWPSIPGQVREIYQRTARTELSAEDRGTPMPSHDDLVLEKAKDLCWKNKTSEIQEDYLDAARAALAPKPSVPETVEEIEAALDRVAQTAPTGEIREQWAALIHSWLMAAKGGAA